MTRRAELDGMLARLSRAQGRPAGYAPGALVLTSANPGDGWRYRVAEMMESGGQHEHSPSCAAALMLAWLEGAVFAAEANDARANVRREIEGRLHDGQYAASHDNARLALKIVDELHGMGLALHVLGFQAESQAAHDAAGAIAYNSSSESKCAPVALPGFACAVPRCESMGLYYWIGPDGRACKLCQVHNEAQRSTLEDVRLNS